MTFVGVECGFVSSNRSPGGLPGGGGTEPELQSQPSLRDVVMEGISFSIFFVSSDIQNRQGGGD